MRKLLRNAVLVSVLFSYGCAHLQVNKESPMNRITPPYQPTAQEVSQRDVDRFEELKKPDYELPSLYQK